MSTKLGSQLRSAMSQAKQQALEEHSAKASHQMPLASIHLPQTQPRRYFDPDAMQNLTESVRQHGVLQPLLVRPHAEAYELVAGERRYRAAKEAGLKTVPVIVREMQDGEVGQFALLENLQREDLNPVEETEGVLQLLSLQLGKSLEEVRSLLWRMQNEMKGNVTHNVMGNTSDDATTHNVMGKESAQVEEVFKRLGTMTWESYVTNRLPLLNLPNDVLEALRCGQLAYTKALLIARVKDKDARQEILSETISSNIPIAQLRARLKELREPSKPRTHNLMQRIKQVAKHARSSQIGSDSEKMHRAEQLLMELEALLKDVASP